MQTIKHNDIEYKEGSKIEVVDHEANWIFGTLKYDGFCGWYFDPEYEEEETLIVNWDQVRIAKGANRKMKKPSKIAE